MELPSLSDITTRMLTENVLSAVMHGRSPSCVPALLPEHFPLFTDREIWRVMTELDSEGKPIDIVPLVQRLERTTTLEPGIDWQYYLVGVFNAGGPGCMLMLEENAGIMIDNWRRWKIICEAMDLTRPLPGALQLRNARPPFTVHYPAEAFEPIPPTNWLVEPLLAPETLVMIYAESDSKKTYSAYSLAACAVKGVHWLRFPTRICRVLIIDEESGDRRMRLRMRECFNGVGADASVGLIWLTMEHVRLDDPACVAAIERLILEQHIDLVMVDSLAKVTTGDENSKEYMNPVMSNLRGIVEHTKVCMLFIHHSRKDNGIYRGSTVIKDSVDMMIRVESKRGKPFVDFKMEKNRDGEVFDFSAMAFWKTDEAAPEKNQFYLERMETRKVEDVEKRMGAREHIIAYLEENGESSLKEMVEALEGTCSATAVRQGASAMEKDKTIKRTNPGSLGRNQSAIYVLSSPEEELSTEAEK